MTRDRAGWSARWAALTPAQRSRRKQDLLLASALARTQALGAIDLIGERADGVVQRARQWQAWLSNPRLWVIASAAGSAVGLAALARLRGLRLLRWGLLGWRVWQAAAPWLAGALGRRQGP
jgi:hypothetical protein